MHEVTLRLIRHIKIPGRDAAWDEWWFTLKLPRVPVAGDLVRWHPSWLAEPVEQVVIGTDEISAHLHAREVTTLTQLDELEQEWVGWWVKVGGTAGAERRLR